MDLKSDRFDELSRKALLDESLQRALKRTVMHLKGMRETAFSELDPKGLLRDRAHEIKTRTLDRLDEYLMALERKVLELGGKVHWACDGKEARDIIERIAAQTNARTIVKGKSMVTEEISLNHELMAAGFEVSETDLGEFIIQLAQEPPSHLVGPAIHKTKEDIAGLFVDKLGAPLMTDPGDMTLFARERLRRKFLEADMGITGVNFAVAETGSVVLFENEGNIRFSTTLPRVHVAVMGLEKVVPTLEDLRVLMKLLARSCTGQKLSSYVSMIAGPRRRGETDGAEEFHLVILDNGRSRILADRELREILFCIRCGACLNFCPVYQNVGGHAYGWVYSGPMGSILTPQLADRNRAYKLPFACTLCGACGEACPVKIDLPGMILALRRRYAEDPAWDMPVSAFEKTIWNLAGYVMKHRSLYEKCSLAGRIIQGPLLKIGRFGHVQPLAKKMFRQTR